MALQDRQAHAWVTSAVALAAAATHALAAAHRLTAWTLPTATTGLAHPYVLHLAAIPVFAGVAVAQSPSRSLQPLVPAAVLHVATLAATAIAAVPALSEGLARTADGVTVLLACLCAAAVWCAPTDIVTIRLACRTAAAVCCAAVLLACCDSTCE